MLIKALLVQISSKTEPPVNCRSCHNDLSQSIHLYLCFVVQVCSDQDPPAHHPDTECIEPDLDGPDYNPTSWPEASRLRQVS
jgi:hypothetical protein